MFKIMRYSVPYLPAIVLATALLFVQVSMDLALPDYLSKIVNIGIQQGGLESPVPEKLSVFTGEKIKMFLDGGYTGLFEDSYVLSGNPDELLLSKKGKDLLNSNISFRKDFLMSLIISVSNMAGEKIPPEEVFEVLSGGRKEQIAGKIKEQFKSRITDNMLDQAAIQAVRKEYGILGIDIPELQNRYILRTGGYMLILALISAAATILVGFLAARVSAGTARNIRSDLFTRIEGLSNAEFDHFSTASLITRNTNDVMQVQRLSFMLIRMFLYAPIMGAGAVIRAFGKAPSMGWIIALAVILLMGLIGIVMAVTLPKYKAIQGLVDRINRVAREQLTGLLVVRAFNRQEFEKKRFDEVNRDLTEVNLYVNRVMVTLMPFITLIMNVLSLAIIWIGAHQVAQSELQVGDMMAFLQYAMQIVMSFLMLSMAFIFIPRASVSAERIDEVLKSESSVKNPSDPVHFSGNVRGEIRFDNVGFKYPGADDYALDAISFTAAPGETTAIIGSTGSGKTSLVNLIPRFYDVTEGEILFDGMRINDIDLSELRQEIGFVPQKSVLFSGTIKSNLCYGSEECEMEKIEKAASVSQSAGFIKSKRDGFNSPVSQGGANISGGQKQRLSIARALVKGSPVLIFDDCFSALDFKTEAELRLSLEKEYEYATRIIVSQRVSTIIGAEQILVLDKGRLVGKGTHKELMKSCPAYQEIVLSQLSIKEV